MRSRSRGGLVSGRGADYGSFRIVREGGFVLGGRPNERYSSMKELKAKARQARLRHGEFQFEQRLQAELAAWDDLPAGGGTTGQRMRRLLGTEPSGALPTTGALAEARVARRLMHAGCGLEFELPTPNGRTCDFEVTVNGEKFFLHVKCPTLAHPRRATLPSFLRSIEHVPRPFLVEVDWRSDLNDSELAAFASEARQFVAEASMGEELLHRDHDGVAAGTVRITGTVQGDRASVVVVSFVQGSIARVGRLLERAHEQFMPGGENVILILTELSAHDRLVDLALLGTHVERWDKLPRGDHHVAHGRAEDGFWTRCRFDRSRVVSWMQMENNTTPARLWFRDSGEPGAQLRETIACVLGAD